MVGAWGYRTWVFAFLLSFLLPIRLVQADEMSMQDRWNNFRVPGQAAIDPDILEILKDRHFIYVPGIMNELGMAISVYYSDAVNLVRNEIGATASYVLPESRQSFSKNAAKISKGIYEASARLRKPIVAEGHSKGGAGLFHAILRHPHLIWDHIVDRVILTQAAIGGSPLAEKTDMGYALSFFHFILKDGLASLDPDQAEKEHRKSLQQFEYALNARFGSQGPAMIERKRKEVSDRIYYIRTQKGSEGLSLGTRIVLGVCNQNLDHRGSNDGLLMVEDQKSTALGRDLGVLENTDHVDLSVGGIFSNLSAEHRQAFSKALWTHIYQDKF